MVDVVEFLKVIIFSLFSSHWPYLIVLIFPIFRAICFTVMVPKINGQDGWLAFLPGGYDYVKAKAADLPAPLAILSFVGELVALLFVSMAVFIGWKSLHILISDTAAAQAGVLAQVVKGGVLAAIKNIIANLSSIHKTFFVVAIIFATISVFLNFFYWVRIAAKAGQSSSSGFVGALYMLSWGALIGVYIYTNSRWALLMYLLPTFILLYLTASRAP
ncbi:hypothetical protein CL620_02250, partial [archaeon]|nr:hypothetical protein [archaeon]